MPAYSPAWVGPSPLVQRESEREKGQPQWVEVGWPGDCSPQVLLLAAASDLAGGRSHWQRAGVQGTAEGKQNPLSSPCSGAGNRGSETGSYLPEITQQGWEEEEGNAQSAHPRNSSFPASLEGFHAGTGSGEPRAGLLCPEHRGPGEAAGRAGGSGRVCKEIGAQKEHAEGGRGVARRSVDSLPGRPRI